MFAADPLTLAPRGTPMPSTVSTDRARRSRRLCVAAATLALAAAARPAAAGEAAQVASLWLGSEAAVKSAAEQAGAPLPPMVSVAALEQFLGQALPSIQSGDVRTDAPLGLLVVAGGGLNGQQQVGLALPLKAGAVPLDKVANATKTDAADTVGVTGGPFVRRTADYLVAGYSQPVVAKLDVAAQSAAMRPAADGSRTPVVSLSVDVAAIRRAVPDQFQAAMDQMRRQADSDPDPSQRAARKYGLNGYETFDQFSLSVDQVPAGWQATVGAQPFPTGHVGSYPRPGLPVTIAARVDVQVTAAEVLPYLKQIAAVSADAGEGDVTAELVTATLLGDAESYGVGLTAPGEAGKPVLYVVTQRTQNGDLAAELAKVKADAAGLKPAAAASYVPATYTGGGGQLVYRFTSKEKDGTKIYLDVTARGGLRYATLTPADAHLVDALVTARPEAGAFDTPASGWVEPGKLPDVAAAVASMHDAADAMPADQRQRLAALFGSSRVTFVAKPSNRGVSLVADVPLAVVKAIRPAIEAEQN